jgi:hypothetical protein
LHKQIRKTQKGVFMNRIKDEVTNREKSSDAPAMNANQKNTKGFAEKAAQGTPESSKKAPPVEQGQSDKGSNPKDYSKVHKS